MCSTNTILKLLNSLPNDVLDSTGARLRLRQKDDETIELARLIPTACSCSMYQPRILVDISTATAIPISYYDNVAHPIRHIELVNASEEEEKFMDDAFAQLFAVFQES